MGLAVSLLGLSVHGQIAPATSGLPSNSFITAINPGVSLSPSSVSSFSTFGVGPIDGITFNSSNRYISSSGGTTPWITVTLNFNSSGLLTGQSYFLAFMVTNKSDNAYSSGLAIDSVSGVLTQNFDTGSSSLPSGWALQGSGASRGILSPSVTGLAPPSAGGTQFAFIDNGLSADTTGTITTSAIGGTNGTVLTSPTFTFTTGSTLSFQVAFLSNDGSPYLDFALVQLFKSTDVPLTNLPAATLFTAIAPSAVPEPATVALLIGGMALGAAWCWRRRATPLAG